jgi:hypothetical protein
VPHKPPISYPEACPGNLKSLALPLRLAVCLALTGGSSAIEFYVSPNGNDGWAGTIRKPYATLERARDAIRQWKQRQGGLKQPATVWLRQGTYSLSEPFILGPEDSGTRDCPITYCAYKREPVTISGGSVIKGFQPAEVNGHKLLAADLPDVQAGKWYFTQLFINGQRRQRPRLPREGFARIAGLDEVPDKYGTRRDKFRFNPGDISASWSNLDDIELVILHFWVSVRTGIKAVDEATRTVHLTKPSHRRLTDDFNKTVFARYYVENVFEALDAPGQWYLDRKEGRLYYYPVAGEAAARITAVAPRMESLVRASAVSNICFRGITFAHTEYALAPGDSGDRQAAIAVPGAILFQNSAECSVENCAIARVGTYGIEIGPGCRNCRVERCAIHDLGGGGVKLNAGSEGTVVADNDLADGGKIFRQAVGVWVGNSPNNSVVHNHVHDFDYTGVSVGWVWGYGPSKATNNLVEYNHIHDIGRGVLTDMGGIYTLGVSPGTRLTHNLIHDINSHTYGGWGIYTDEGSSYLLIEDNVVYRTRTGGFHQHYGRENVLRNNVFAFGTEQQIQRSRMEEHISFRLDHNIVYYDRGALLSGNWKDDRYQMDYNLYWDASGRPVTFLKEPLEAWQKRGHDVHSLIANPEFRNPQKSDFSLKAGSPAFKLGFKPIDLSGVGPRFTVGPPR